MLLCRRPAFGVRINRGAVQASTEQLVTELSQLGVQAEASRFLPHEFLRVAGGMQQLIAGGLLADGQCQVRALAATVRASDSGVGAQMRRQLVGRGSFVSGKGWEGVWGTPRGDAAQIRRCCACFGQE